MQDRLINKRKKWICEAKKDGLKMTDYLLQIIESNEKRKLYKNSYKDIELEELSKEWSIKPQKGIRASDQGLAGFCSPGSEQVLLEQLNIAEASQSKMKKDRLFMPEEEFRLEG